MILGTGFEIQTLFNLPTHSNYGKTNCNEFVISYVFEGVHLHDQKQ